MQGAAAREARSGVEAARAPLDRVREEAGARVGLRGVREGLEERLVAVSAQVGHQRLRGGATSARERGRGESGRGVRGAGWSRGGGMACLEAGRRSGRERERERAREGC